MATTPGEARTAWARNDAAPLRTFLRTESGSAGVLLMAVVAALVWANIDPLGYERLRHATFAIRAGDVQVVRDFRTWINSGLMTFFFLVAGLEARREFDLGDLRDRRRFVLPFAAGLIGMVVPVAIYLTLNAGRASAHGWGVAMSTDTALALGVLALVGRDVPDRVRVFLLTVFAVDDLAALLIIALVYSDHIELVHLGLAVAVFAALLVTAVLRVRRRAVYLVLGTSMWAALLASGVDPDVAGLVIGLSARAYTPARGKLEEATHVAITCGRLPEQDGVVGEIFCAETLLVGLRTEHRLAAKEQVEIAELAGDVLGVPSDALFPAWALAQGQALADAGISPPSVVLEATDLSATAWITQTEVDWILMTGIVMAAPRATVARPVVPAQLVPFTLPVVAELFNQFVTFCREPLTQNLELGADRAPLCWLSVETLA